MAQSLTISMGLVVAEETSGNVAASASSPGVVHGSALGLEVDGSTSRSVDTQRSVFDTFSWSDYVYTLVATSISLTVSNPVSASSLCLHAL